jgi:chemotaxis protein MotB
MADSEQVDQHREIFIIKHNHGEHESHHGGAWKIAFADFMTAMMALFLVLWLISSTSEKTRHTVAQYFNPVKLVDMSTLKKGFRDPKETEMGSGPNPNEAQKEADSSKPNPPPGKAKETNAQADAKGQASREAALFRDPYAVLAEIEASAPVQPLKSSPAGEASSNSDDSTGGFTDPFTTVPHEAEKPIENALPLAQSKGDTLHGREVENESADADDKTAPSQVQASEPNVLVQKSLRVGQASEANSQMQGSSRTAQAAVASNSSTSEAAKLKSSISQALNDIARTQNLPRVEIQATAEGILISLTDDARFSMFAVGSAEPRPETVRVMEKIGRILNAGSGFIVIRGHTDGRPYRSGIYDNWRLSAARAQMALYMLTRGGVSEKRIEKVEGYADHRLKSPDNPNGSENRRIEILLRKDKP